MIFDENKELTPVIYDSSSIKLLPAQAIPPNGLCFPLHWHDRLELALVHSGQMRLLLGENSILVSAGELAIINPSQLHGGFAGQVGVSYTTIMFEPAILRNNSQASINLIEPIIRHTVRFYNRTSNEDIIQAVQQLMTYAKIEDLSSPLLIQGKAYELLGLLYHTCMRPLSTEAIDDDRFRAVLAYINEHYCANLTSRAVSSKFSYEESYFCRRFKANTDMTFTQYVQLLRLEKAQKLLCSRQIRTRDLAASCGFTDVGYFCRCFKNHFGVSPLTYQKQHRIT